VLLLVEGQSDQKTLPVLARKIIGPRIGIDVRVVSQGDMLTNARKVVAHIKAAIRRDTSKALLCVDSECTEIDRTRARLETVTRQVAGSFPRLSVKAVVVDHALEGWLLQDRQSVGRFLGLPERQLRYSNPENHCRPAELMDRLVRRAKIKDYTKPGKLPDLAKQVDPQQIASASPTFEIFRRMIAED
jgi:hypothetical protein